MKRIIRASLFLAALSSAAGCKTITTTGPDGQPVETTVIDGDKVEQWGNAVSGALPPPWNLLAGGAVGIAVGLINKSQKEKRP